MKAHVCVGGPLDGEFATSEDFYGYPARDEKGRLERLNWTPRETGMYQHLRNEYQAYHNAHRSNVPVLWIHTSLLKPPISPRKR